MHGRPYHSLDGGEERVARDGFRQKGVHSGGKTLLYALSCIVGGHGDNGRVLAAGRLHGANSGRYMKSIHLRHADVHQNDIECRSRAGHQGFVSIAGESDGMSTFCQKAGGYALIDRVVVND
jgi:hypothetical protein